jgi:uncharacterized damage-inducible protein DinB
VIEQAFLEFSAGKLAQLRDRIHDCAGRLTPDQIWLRGSDSENAVGNLVLHLAGNVRQWIGHGVAGEADQRDRDAEFAARGGVEKDALLARLDANVDAAIATIRTLAPAELTRKTTIQGYEVTVLEAIYHVVEHFAQHTAQIIFATKLLTGSDLGYYKHLSKASHQQATP